MAHARAVGPRDPDDVLPVRVLPRVEVVGVGTGREGLEALVVDPELDRLRSRGNRGRPVRDAAQHSALANARRGCDDVADLDVRRGGGWMADAGAISPRDPDDVRPI